MHSLVEHVLFQVKNTNQKADFIALGIEEKTSRLHKAEAMLLEVPMSCSESEKNERKFHSGAVPCIRDAATLEMDEKNAETMEKLSSDAPIFYPEVVLSDHTYVTKVKAEKEQHMILPEDIPDSISLLVRPVDHTNYFSTWKQNAYVKCIHLCLGIHRGSVHRTPADAKSCR